MKRGEPLRRTVGLARGPLSLNRKTPLARTAAKRAPRQPAQEPRGATKTGDWSADTRALVMARCGGRCETCAAEATDLHHRAARRTRNHRPSNALAACRSCHRDHHANPQASRDAGWIVSTSSRPESTPVLIGDRWVFLTDDGRYVDDLELRTP